MNNLTRVVASLGFLLLRSETTPRAVSQAAFLILRVVVGIVMIHNGLDKISDIPGFAEAYVSEIGLPFPIFFSYVAALTELIGAPLLILGLLTRPAAFGLMSTMLVAIYHHIHVAGFSIPSIELSSIYCVCFAFFAINGAGQFSLDQIISDRFFPQSSVNSETIQSLRNSFAQEYVKVESEVSVTRNSK
jgi:putative oxidoreductase